MSSLHHLSTIRSTFIWALTILILITSPATSLPVTEEDAVPAEDADVASSSPDVVNVHVSGLLSTNWTSVEDSLSSQRCSSSNPNAHHCHFVSDALIGRTTPLTLRSACLWTYVNEEDPFRIPKVIRHARCTCKNCQMSTNSIYGTECVEQHVTIPVVRCDKVPDIGPSAQCYMYLQRVSVACVCAYKLQA
ncbi:hypothetical protein BaRGS_00020960 [Batillaria attramentaria]|uniref:Interleukin 17-like protein n=1 Tax=Batillaria attramentaria TaxID=370345 RepID=A0ABD0KL30_9CAEN|nr:hypothetical protein BaRGS_022900 [Batillaria attramentaria]